MASPPPPEGQPPLRLAIVGGGIAGLALAMGLLRQGSPHMSVTVYESAPTFSTVGAGIGLGPNALRAAEMLAPGFGALFSAISSGNLNAGKEHIMMDALLCEEGFGLSRTGWGVPQGFGADIYLRKSAHRRDLLDLLASQVPDGIVRFGMHAVGMEQSASPRGGNDQPVVRITFANGQVVEADLVVGSDGIRGSSRAAVLGDRFPECVPARYAARYAYRRIVPMHVAMRVMGKDAMGNELAGDAKMFMGKQAIVVAFPISKGAEYNVVCFRPTGPELPWEGGEWTVPVGRDVMRRDLEDAGVADRLIRLLEAAESEPMRWAIHDHPITPTYYCKRICLAGDSAHAATPHQAAGAGQSLEDALVLARLLALVRSPAQIEIALAVYDSIRRPRAQRMVQTSRETGRVFALAAPGLGDDLGKVVDHMNRSLLWIWEHDLQADLDRATESFSREWGRIWFSEEGA